MYCNHERSGKYSHTKVVIHFTPFQKDNNKFIMMMMIIIIIIKLNSYLALQSLDHVTCNVTCNCITSIIYYFLYRK